MRLCSIASGSSGNCIYVGDDQTHLLVDTGISKKRIEEGLSKLEIKGDELEGILITHEHVDHIQGLGVFSRKYEIPIYATPGTIAGIRNYKKLGNLPDGLLHEVDIDQPFSLGTLNIDPFAISHDANEPSGYRIDNNPEPGPRPILFLVLVDPSAGFKFDKFISYNLFFQPIITFLQKPNVSLSQPYLRSPD